MNLSERKRIHPALPAVIAGALSLGLAACERPTYSPDKGAAAPADKPPAIAMTPAPEAADKAGQPTAPDAKAAAEADKASQDAALVSKVRSAISSDPDLKRVTVDVTASDGTVTLFGTADTAGNRDKAAKLASDVPGVKSVNNKMAVVAGS